MFPQRKSPHGAPPFRRLRGYAFDPSLPTRLETAVVNHVVFRVRWEPLAAPPGDCDPHGAEESRDREAAELRL